MRDQASRACCDLLGTLTLRSQHDHATMRSWRMPPNIGESPVERDEQASLFDGSGKDYVVGSSSQPFAQRIVDIVSSALQEGSDGYGDVLVELDPHECDPK